MFWYNGELHLGNTLELALDDPGLIYGATVFTTLRVYEQSLDHPLTHWQGHCDRLHHSLQSFNWSSPDWSHLRQGAEALMADFPVLRLVVFPDGREWITGRPLPSDLQERQGQGIVAWLTHEASLHRSLPEHKTGNYLSPWIAGQKAQKLGAKEAILVDNQGTWLETSTGNLWGWKEGTWWTPPLGAILPGTVRSQLLFWLTSQGIVVQQQPWTFNQVHQFETLVYTNSVVEVIPIAEVLTPSNPLKYQADHPAIQPLQRFFSPENFEKFDN